MLAPPDRHTPRAHVFSSPDEQPLEAALAETQTLLEQHGYLIALYPATLPTRYLHRLHTIRSLLESRLHRAAAGRAAAAGHRRSRTAAAAALAL